MPLPTPSPTAVPRAAIVLGAAGVVPFAASAAIVLAGGVAAPLAQLAILTYGAVILAFLGGVHWGLALRDPAPQTGLLVAGVVPSLVGWAGVLIGGGLGLALLILGFLGVLALDGQLARAGTAPAWYPRLRLPLTAAVVACLLVAAVRSGA